MKNKLNISVSKFQKTLQLSGGKVKSSFILLKAIKNLAKNKKNPGNVLILSLDNICPFFLVKTKKRGKKISQVPSPIYSMDKRFAIASRWVIKNSRKHNTNFFIKNFVNELSDASINQGFSKKQQQELNKLAILNRSSL